MIKLTAFFVILSSILTILSAVPYIADIMKGKTRPRIVSWFTWSLLSGITCVATFSDGQYPTAILMFLGTLETLLIVVLGWRYGDRRIEPLDIICQVGAVAGLGLWLTLHSASLAVLTTMTVDFIGSVPTLVHAWRKPYEETWITFGLASLAGVCTLAVARNWHITSSLAPAYLFIMNGAIAIIIISRNRFRVRADSVISATIEP